MIVAAVALAIVLAQQLGGGKPVIAWTAVPEVCTLSSAAITPYASLIETTTPGSTADPSILMATTTGSLITDCNSLLAARDTLQPSASSTASFKDWSAGKSMHDWSGVVVCPRADGGVDGGNCSGVASGSPPRVVSLACGGCDLRNGSLHAALGNLHKLKRLNLGRAGLTGAIPAALGNLKELDLLALRGYNLSTPSGSRQYVNTLSGQIPPELGQMSSLEDLWLEGNQLTGSIPPELGNLANLERLYLDENLLTGSIPKELGDIGSLEDFRATSNSRHDADGNQTNTGLTGSIPGELGDLSNLQVLRLEYNSLSGSIPSELGDLSAITELRLTGNDLTGSIPPELGQLSTLRRLQLGRNQLSGSIPAALSGLTNLSTLYLHANKQTTTDAVSGEMTVTHSGLTGTLPSQLGSLDKVAYMALFGNSLEGVIPPEWSGMTSMVRLWVWDNPDLITRVALTPDKASMSEGDGATTVNVTARVDAGSEWLARVWARPVSAGTANYTSAFTGQDAVVEARGSGGANVVGFAAAATAAFTIPSAIATIEPPLTAAKRSALPSGMGSAVAAITITPEDDSVVESDESISLSVSGKGVTVHSGGNVYHATRLVTGAAGAITLADDDATRLVTPTPTRTPMSFVGPGLSTTQTATLTPTQTPMTDILDPSITQTATRSPTVTLTPTPTQMSLVGPGLLITMTPTPTAGATRTHTATATATIAGAATATATHTPVGGASDPPIVIVQPTHTATGTMPPAAGADATSTATATIAGTGSPTATATITGTAIPAATATPEGRDTRMRQPTRTPRATATAGAGWTATAVAMGTGTAVAMGTVTPIPTVTAVASVTGTVTAVATITPVATLTGTPGVMATVMPMATLTATPAVAPTGTVVVAARATGTPEADDSPARATATLTPTATGVARDGVGERAVAATFTATAIATATFVAGEQVGVADVGETATAAARVVAQGVVMGGTGTVVVAGARVGNGVGEVDGEGGVGVAGEAGGPGDDGTPGVMTSVVDGGGFWWWLVLALVGAYVAWRAWRRWRWGRAP